MRRLVGRRNEPDRPDGHAAPFGAAPAAGVGVGGAGDGGVDDPVEAAGVVVVELVGEREGLLVHEDGFADGHGFGEDGGDGGVLGRVGEVAVVGCEGVAGGWEEGDEFGGHCCWLVGWGCFARGGGVRGVGLRSWSVAGVRSLRLLSGGVMLLE